ncbi:hypothetical protein AOLI_G00190010 [Acnodon oligacanthus]
MYKRGAAPKAHDRVDLDCEEAWPQLGHKVQKGRAVHQLDQQKGQRQYQQSGLVDWGTEASCGVICRPATEGAALGLSTGGASLRTAQEEQYKKLAMKQDREQLRKQAPQRDGQREEELHKGPPKEEKRLRKPALDRDGELAQELHTSGGAATGEAITR